MDQVRRKRRQNWSGEESYHNLVKIKVGGRKAVMGVPHCCSFSCHNALSYSAFSLPIASRLVVLPDTSGTAYVTFVYLTPTPLLALSCVDLSSPKLQDRLCEAHSIGQLPPSRNTQSLLTHTQPPHSQNGIGQSQNHRRPK
jgi:hypothetical protein